MKQKYINLLILPLLILCGCEKTPDKIAPSEQRLATLLNNFDINKVTKFDFVDRSFDYASYYNAKYLITGNPKKAVVNYEARHQFELFNDNIVDSISVDALEGVENPVNKKTIEAKGQIYTVEEYLYDYLVCESEPDQSFVNCYEIDYFNNLDSYFNYLSIIKTAFEAFSSPDTYYSEEDGYSPVDIMINSNKDIDKYTLSTTFAGDTSYKPFLIDFDIEYNNKTNSFEKISYSERSMLNNVDGDYETETDSLRKWTITNIELGEKVNYSNQKYTFENITDKNKIHNAPKQVVDVSNKENGLLDDNTSLEIIKNIYAYSKNVRQTNYSMYYHDAFDIANTDTTIGDVKFEGKIIGYKNNVTDNVGKIQKVNKDGLPTSEAPANYRILTEIVDEDDYQGVLRTALFDKYMTSCLAFSLESTFTSSRAYLDPNPLYWNEISDILDGFSTYNLGNNLTESKTIQMSVSGNKEDNKLVITGQIHTTVANFVEYIDTFTFNIEDNLLTYCKFTSSGKQYTDTYEARFVYGEKTYFTGEKISEDISTQVEMSAFNII